MKKKGQKSRSKTDIQINNESEPHPLEKIESISIDSISTIPHIEEICNYSYAPWMSPRIIADYYKKVLNGLSKNILAANDLATKLTLLNIESIKRMNQ